ncbi:porin [Paraburkholderia humisilvae]|uniref:Outer membrane porin protein 32 n=1 Tax=Paraburkholderia humisilvae TaxID=627669 RepID=A0A6J5EVY0_9BURK|nr:porin [Paraburkholderia humisilvae]CAB3769737.1 Outer membrane porin protein 32 [Paraburkholderia humisilvae]
MHKEGGAVGAARVAMLTRSLAAVTLMGVGSAAYAQSSVTLYGSLDGGLRNLVNGTKAGGAALSMASNGTYNSNRWGFLGKEDLGGGYYARFNLEAGYVLSTGQNNNTNNQLFQRTSTVGFGGPFGQVDIGHQFTLQHHLIKDFEPFDFHYLSITEATAVSGGSTGRDDNDINYHGFFGPWVIRAEYALGGVPGSVASGSVLGGGVNYRSETVSLGAGYTHRSNALSATSEQFFNSDQYTAGGALTVGPVDLMAGYSLVLQDVPANVEGKTRNQYLWGGVRYQVTRFFNVTAAYYDNRNTTAGVDGRKGVAILGLVYLLSKRTELYADVDYTRFTGGYVTNATLNPSRHPTQTGVSFGVNHWF